MCCMGNFLQLCDQVISLYVQAKEWGNWQSCGLKNQKLSHFSINIHLSSQIQSSYAPSQANVVAIVTRLRAGCPRNRCPIPCIRNVQNNLLFFDTGAYSRGIERLEREVENTRPASESAECVELYIQYPYAFMARTGTTVLMPSDMFCVYSQLH